MSENARTPKEVILEKVRLAAGRCLSKDLLEKVSVYVEEEYLTGDIFVKLQATVYGRTAGVISYPADWWQAFKDRWFPRWAKGRWPVRQTRINVVDVYPSIPIPEHAPYRVTWPTGETMEEATKEAQP